MIKDLKTKEIRKVLKAVLKQVDTWAEEGGQAGEPGDPRRDLIGVLAKLNTQLDDIEISKK